MSTGNMPSRDELASKFAAQVMDAERHLHTTLVGVDALAAFASYSLYRLMDNNKDRPAQHHRPGPAAVELAAWTLFPEFGKGGSRDAKKIQLIVDALERHASAISLSEIFPTLEEGEQDDKLAAHLRLHSGVVRGSAYPVQIVRRIESVLQPLEKEFAVLAGIGPMRACEFIKALGTQTEANINAMRDSFSAMRARGDLIFRKGKECSPEDRAELEALSEKMKRSLDGMAGDWIPTKKQIFERLPDATDLEWTALSAIVGFTVKSRGQIGRIVDAQDRPVFFVDEQRAFYVHSGQCFDAIFGHFDELARNNPLLRDRYGRIVAEWMETEIQRQMERLFPKSCVLRSACFLDPDNAGGETEADVIVIWGPFLIVAEAKGKRIGRDALRGSRSRLRKTLSDNIQDAFFQARRVIRVLDRDGKIRFKEKSGEQSIVVSREDLLRIMPISVTLQHLAGIPTQLAATQQLGLFKGRAYPWSVSIDDLDVITRFCGTGDVLLHYIERRLAHQGIKVGIQGDELDIFGQYLDTRLHPSLYEKREEILSHSGSAPMVAFNGGEERFEPFYVAEWLGEPPPSEKVELALPSEISSVLRELRVRTDCGARWIAFALLDLSGSALKQIDAAIRSFRSAAILHGQRVIRTTFSEGDIVINILAHRAMHPEKFREVAALRARMEHYRHKPRATIAIGIDQRQAAEPFDTAIWVEGPWEREEIMEEALAQDPGQARVVHLGRSMAKPGRNDPCPCGSGKKFKRCCIDLITFDRHTQND